MEAGGPCQPGMRMTEFVQDSDRRDVGRAHVHAVVGIDATDRLDRVGITRNISEKGALFHSASRFSPGEKLSLVLRTPGSEEDARIEARVVRTELDDSDAATMFRHLTAVEFAEPFPVQ